MSYSEFFIGNTKIDLEPKTVIGEYCIVDDVEYYKITNHDMMRPFFMTVVSASDHWLFISSNGALSAGRKNSNSSLFPYYTEDKIIDSLEITGSKSLFKVEKKSKTYLWEPFTERYSGIYRLKRNLYKSRIGNRILFEETNEDLELSFKYLWTFSDRFGFVKKSSLKNLSNEQIEIELLDGIQNILPFGVNNDLQNSKSTLVDAYKKSELDQASGIGIFTLSAMIVDKAEPSESLLATTSWSAGLDVTKHLLCSLQLNHFREGQSLISENDIRGERGSYFINCKINLSSLKTSEWYIVSDVNQSLIKIADTQIGLAGDKGFMKELEEDISRGTEDLLKKIGIADGLQCTNDRLSTGRHLSNTLFNIMRGGIFEDLYEIDLPDLRNYISTLNKSVYKQNIGFIDKLTPGLHYQTLISETELNKDIDLERLIYEYLPLSFSRRHGDPSRPWNLFSIEVKGNTGQKTKYYEGNWRDIFQNWEALAISFPEYIEGMITKFVNASTIDGYNPYRISRTGFDWEIVEPEDPWSFIGYWGDHQIVYLLKLLDLSNAHHPGRLRTLLNKQLNVYANVPYRIKGYKNIINNPSDTIDFAHEMLPVINERTNKLGSDGKLVFDLKNHLVRATLLEKILVSVLTKLYNFVPGAGIWLNTQRPEWNDANNALVGNGTSMVTLFYLRRFLKLGIDLFKHIKNDKVEINSPVADLLETLYIEFSSRLPLLTDSFSDVARKKMMDSLGTTGENYRKAAYNGFTGEKKYLKVSSIIKMFEVSITFLDHSIKCNKREDGLYHSYNLIEIKEDKVSVSHLYEMLEGQVAALSSQILNAKEAIDLLGYLKQSKIYRANQDSYLLYPDRDLPTFLRKNEIPDDFIVNSKLAQTLIRNNDISLLEKDRNNKCHFNGIFHNANDIRKALDKLLNKKEYVDLVNNEYESILSVFEQMFDHKSYTGRSGTFYAYEGLGSIYWHMVSKLLVATQENIFVARKEHTSNKTISKLIKYYYQIRDGIGINKRPDLYGAFPTDAYSHTPGNRGVRQPGMTGQVKEDIINRWAELGLIVENGQLSFNPIILRKEEYLSNENTFEYYDLNLIKRSLTLPRGSLAFTYCQVPIIYILSDEERLEVFMSDGSCLDIVTSKLSPEISRKICKRTGEVEMIKFYLSPFF